MSSRKLVRLATKAIERLGVDVISAVNQSGHYHLTLKLPNGEQRRITMSCSPKVLEHTVGQVVGDVKRMLRG